MPQKHLTMIIDCLKDYKHCQFKNEKYRFCWRPSINQYTSLELSEQEIKQTDGFKVLEVII